MMMNQWWRWVGGVCLASQGCQVCQKCQERALSRYLPIYRAPRSRELLGARGVTGRTPASGRRMASMWPSLKPRALDLNGQVHELAKLKIDQTHSSKWPDLPTCGIRSSPLKVQSRKAVTGRTRSNATWRTGASGLHCLTHCTRDVSEVAFLRRVRHAVLPASDYTPTLALPLLCMIGRYPASGLASDRVARALGQTSYHSLKMTGLAWPASGQDMASVR
jgi:hypothetical protein